MKRLKNAKWVIMVLPLLFLGACGGGGGGGGDTAATLDTGTLSLSMVDASDDSYQAVYVSIKEVQVCEQPLDCDNQGAGETQCECEQWQTVAEPNKTYNLLELVDGATAVLGEKELAPGTYNQMRLLLWDGFDDTLNINGDAHSFPQYLIDSEGKPWEMKVPSGYQSGIKLTSHFDIVEGQTTELILDFDAARSIHEAGKNHKYILRPTIKVLGAHGCAVVAGVVADEGTQQPMAGVLINAWKEGTTNQPTSTYTNDEGGYTLNLSVGAQSENYTIVAAGEGYAPECVTVNVEKGQTFPGTDFELVPIETTTVSGIITGTMSSPSAEAPIVTISFKQIGECFVDPVETAFTTATDDDDVTTLDVYYDETTGEFQYTYDINLPMGTYDMTASTEGLNDVEELNVVISGETEMNINF